MQTGWLMVNGWVDAGDSPVHSTRAEAQGLLDAMRGLWGVWDGEVHHRLDNESVVKVHGQLQSMTEEQWAMLGDKDVWLELEVWRRRWGGRYKVLWHRGHPERRMPHKCDWGPHDWGNFWCDLRCDWAMRERWCWGEQLEREGQGGWRLVVQGRLVTQGYRAAVRERLGERHLELYLKQMGHQRQHKRLSRLLVQLGKAPRARR